MPSFLTRALPRRRGQPCVFRAALQQAYASQRARAAVFLHAPTPAQSTLRAGHALDPVDRMCRQRQYLASARAGARAPVQLLHASTPTSPFWVIARVEFCQRCKHATNVATARLDRTAPRGQRTAPRTWRVAGAPALRRPGGSDPEECHPRFGTRVGCQASVEGAPNDCALFEAHGLPSRGSAEQYDACTARSLAAALLWAQATDTPAPAPEAYSAAAAAASEFVRASARRRSAPRRRLRAVAFSVIRVLISLRYKVPGGPRINAAHCCHGLDNTGPCVRSATNSRNR